jgi:hypothetical protein
MNYSQTRKAVMQNLRRSRMMGIDGWLIEHSERRLDGAGHLYRQSRDPGNDPEVRKRDYDRALEQLHILNLLLNSFIDHVVTEARRAKVLRVVVDPMRGGARHVERIHLGYACPKCRVKPNRPCEIST